MSKQIVDRRSFLRGAIAAPVPLIGTALAAGAYQPTQVGALRGSAKSVLIPTHELAGMLDERLDFPSNWDINVVHMRGYGAPVLSGWDSRPGETEGTAKLPAVFGAGLDPAGEAGHRMPWRAGPAQGPGRL